MVLINKINWNIRAREKLLVEEDAKVATVMKVEVVVSVQVVFMNIHHAIIHKVANCKEFLGRNSGTAGNWTTSSMLLL